MLQLKSMQELTTVGDGACAVHACFGVTNAKAGNICCLEDPRMLLDKILPGSFGEVVQVSHDQELLDTMLGGAFTELTGCLGEEPALPQHGRHKGKGALSEESRTFLKYLRTDKTLLEDVMAQMAKNKKKGEARHHELQECEKKTSSLFSDRLDDAFWREIAAGRGLLPRSIVKPRSAAGPLTDREFDWRSAPWEARGGRRVVKGSNGITAPKKDLPDTKFDALFDQRSVFDWLRYSFLSEISNMDRLQSIRHYAESKRDSLGEVSCERVLRFVRDYRDVFTQQEMDEKPATWEERAWPILRRCMTETRSRYFLSIDELLLVCKCSQQNAAIFSANGVDLIHQASCIHDEQKEIVCVVLQEGPDQQRSTRSHFQRLISEDNVAKLEEKRAKDAAEKKRQKESRGDAAKEGSGGEAPTGS